MNVAASTGVAKTFPGLVAPCHSKLPSRTWRCMDIRFGYENKRITGGRIQCFSSKPSSNRNVLSAGTDHYQLSYEDVPQEPFLLSLIKEAIRAIKSLFVFLVEQPSQLKYIEWPGFQNTLRTATLTLVIVALLIVALSSVDSILCFLLALLLRRTA